MQIASSFTFECNSNIRNKLILRYHNKTITIRVEVRTNSIFNSLFEKL